MSQRKRKKRQEDKQEPDTEIKGKATCEVTTRQEISLLCVCSLGGFLEEERREGKERGFSVCVV